MALIDDLLKVLCIEVGQPYVPDVAFITQFAQIAYRFQVTLITLVPPVELEEV